MDNLQTWNTYLNLESPWGLQRSPSTLALRADSRGTELADQITDSDYRVVHDQTPWNPRTQPVHQKSP